MEPPQAARTRRALEGATRASRRSCLIQHSMGDNPVIRHVVSCVASHSDVTQRNCPPDGPSRAPRPLARQLLHYFWIGTPDHRPWKPHNHEYPSGFVAMGLRGRCYVS